MIFFCFSSRRRHTRSLRDWSSDVCSSDLSALHGFGKTRGCDIDSLFEVWALERIGLIEAGQHAQSAIRKKSFDRNLLARNVTFHKHLIEIRLAISENLR